MELPEEKEPPLDASDFQSAARWIVEGPRSILYDYDHCLWWDKEFQLWENRNAGRSLLTLTVYRPFVCQNGLTWSILRRCEFHRNVLEAVRTNRKLPAVEISYRRIEQTHPHYGDAIFQFAETLLSELRDPPAVGSDSASAAYISRRLSGWFHGALQFLESVQLPRTLKSWQLLRTAVEASASETVEPEQLLERFESKPLEEPIDLPSTEAPRFYQRLDEWRLLGSDE